MLPKYIKGKSVHENANQNTGLLWHIFSYESSSSDTKKISVITCDNSGVARVSGARGQT